MRCERCGQGEPAGQEGEARGARRQGCGRAGRDHGGVPGVRRGVAWVGGRQAARRPFRRHARRRCRGGNPALLVERRSCRIERRSPPAPPEADGSPPGSPESSSAPLFIHPRDAARTARSCCANRSQRPARARGAPAPTPGEPRSWLSSGARPRPRSRWPPSCPPGDHPSPAAGSRSARTAPGRPRRWRRSPGAGCPRDRSPCPRR